VSQFWQNARAKRIALGYSQEEMAKKVGFHQTGYSYFESGKSKRIDRDLMERVALALDTTVRELEGTSDINLRRLPEEVQRWLESEESNDYIVEAYTKYITDKMKSLR